MSGLDHLAISRILGSTVQPFSRGNFGGFSAVGAVGEMLATRPKPPQRLAADVSRDAKIVQAFKKAHKGYSIDRMLADPDLVQHFVEQAQKLGVDAPAALINRRLLRIRKAGQLKVETTVEETRELGPFLIPAELAFAQLAYQYDATYDDLLADPDLGAAFDALALKIGGGGNVVNYRLAALHLRKNIRSRRGNEGQLLANVGLSDLTQRWRPVGALDSVGAKAVPDEAGIFALSEPNRYLFLTKHESMREGVERFKDPSMFKALGNRFWTPSPASVSLQLIKEDEAEGSNLRLLELKALEVYRPIFNLLPKAA